MDRIFGIQKGGDLHPTSTNPLAKRQAIIEEARDIRKAKVTRESNAAMNDIITIIAKVGLNKEFQDKVKFMLVNCRELFEHLKNPLIKNKQDWKEDMNARLEMWVISLVIYQANLL